MRSGATPHLFGPTRIEAASPWCRIPTVGDTDRNLPYKLLRSKLDAEGTLDVHTKRAPGHLRYTLSLRNQYDVESRTGPRSSGMRYAAF